MLIFEFLELLIDGTSNIKMIYCHYRNANIEYLILSVHLMNCLPGRVWLT